MALHTRESESLQGPGCSAAQGQQTGARWAVASVALLLGCGGVTMQRAAGVHKYRPLPLNTEVVALESESQLVGKFARVGELTWVLATANQQGDRDRALTTIKTHAAKYGCDVVTGLSAQRETLKKKKKVRQLGEGGTVLFKTVEENRYRHTYSAACIRTERAPGGLHKGSDEPIALAESAKPPTFAVTPGALSLPRQPADRDDPTARLWARLSAYEGTYLKNWRAALRKPPTDALTVLEAMHELMVQITGATGFWRKTVRNDWYGCASDRKQSQCLTLDKAVKTLLPWNRLQRALTRVKAPGASAFLQRNAVRLHEYLDQLTPTRPNLSAAQQTPFFMRHLR